MIAGLIFDCRQQNPVSVHVMRIRFNKCNCKNTIFFIYYNTGAKSVIKQLKISSLNWRCTGAVESLLVGKIWTKFYFTNERGLRRKLRSVWTTTSFPGPFPWLWGRGPGNEGPGNEVVWTRHRQGREPGVHCIPLQWLTCIFSLSLCFFLLAVEFWKWEKK